MIQTVGRALRRTAGSGVILAMGVGAVSSQPPIVVATSAASALPIQRSLQNERSAPLDERASIIAIRASTQSAAEAVIPPPRVAVRAPLAAKLGRVPAVTRAAAAPPRTSAPAAGNSTGYAFGYCTWWVSHKRTIPWRSNAAQWWWSARAYGFGEGSTPRVGAVMVMGYGVGGASASSGHVAYVESVNPAGSFVISEMNWWGVPGGGWGKVDYRTVTSMTGILGFIY